MSKPPAAPYRPDRNDMDKLTGDVLRQHADAPKTMAWESQARQLLRWAAELIDAAEAIGQGEAK
jgi:hypothetical protein